MFFNQFRKEVIAVDYTLLRLLLPISMNLRMNWTVQALHSSIHHSVRAQFPPRRVEIQPGRRPIWQRTQIKAREMLIQAEEMLIRTGGMLIRIGEMLIQTGGMLIRTGGMLIRNGRMLIRNGGMVIRKGEMLIRKGGMLIRKGGILIRKRGMLIWIGVIRPRKPPFRSRQEGILPISWMEIRRKTV